GSALTAMLQASSGSFRWVAATVDANSAAGYELATGDPVMAIGGFNGSDPAPTLAQFQDYVSRGQIHYFIAGGMRGSGLGAAIALFALAPTPTLSATPPGLDPGVGNVPQGLQADAAYAGSYAGHQVTNVFVTSQQVSCYRPEVPSPFNNGPNDGYTGETPCPGATTGENIGATLYPTQVGSRPGYPAATPMLVTDKSESDIRIDPADPRHVIRPSKRSTGTAG